MKLPKCKYRNIIVDAANTCHLCIGARKDGCSVAYMKAVLNTFDKVTANSDKRILSAWDNQPFIEDGELVWIKDEPSPTVGD